MDEEQKKWQGGLWKYFGPKEFVRFVIILLSLLFSGLILSIVFKNPGFVMLAIAIQFSILWLAPYWQPAWIVLRKISGNENIPARLPKFQGEWWGYAIHYGVLIFKLWILFYVYSIGLKQLFLK